VTAEEDREVALDLTRQILVLAQRLSKTNFPDLHNRAERIVALANMMLYDVPVTPDKGHSAPATP
jgi:hypothetical protein